MKPQTLARLRGIYPLIDDAPRWRREPRELLEAVLKAGVSVVQLRLKHQSDVDALDLCRWARERTRAAGALLIVNDRFDLADLCDADGVHLGQEDVAPERIPEEVRSRLLIGLSTHTHAQVCASRARPVDYIGFGPVFETSTKVSTYSARSLTALARAVSSAGRPVVAIGGIELRRIPEIRQAGAAAAAVLSALADAQDPVAATTRLMGAFEPPIER